MQNQERCRSELSVRSGLLSEHLSATLRGCIEVGEFRLRLW